MSLYYFFFLPSSHLLQILEILIESLKLNFNLFIFHIFIFKSEVLTTEIDVTLLEWLILINYVGNLSFLIV